MTPSMTRANHIVALALSSFARVVPVSERLLLAVPPVPERPRRDHASAYSARVPVARPEKLREHDGVSW